MGAPGEEVERFRRVLAAWAETRDERLANAVRWLGDQLAAHGPALELSDEPAWLARAAGCDPLDVAPLLAAQPAKGWKRARARVLALAQFPPDPRIARAVLKLAHEYRGPRARLLHVAIRAAVRVHGSPDTIFVCLGAEYDAVREACAAMPRSLPEPALLATLARPPSPEAVALFAMVAADPDDRAVHEALADCLLEAGDPRGELISLELALAAGRIGEEEWDRVMALDYDYGPVWFDWLPTTTYRTRYGTLYGAEIEAGHHRLAASVGHPGWTTLRELSVYGTPPPELLTAWLAGLPRLTSLAIQERRGEVVPPLPALAVPNLRSLAVSPDAAIAVRGDLPRLELLEIDAPCDPSIAFAAAIRLGASTVILLSLPAALEGVIRMRGAGPATIEVICTVMVCPEEPWQAPSGWFVTIPREGHRARVLYLQACRPAEPELEVLLVALARTGMSEVRLSTKYPVLARSLARALAAIDARIARGEPLVPLTVTCDAEAEDLEHVARYGWD